MAPSFPTGHYSVELTCYYYEKDVVDMQVTKTLLHFSTIVVSAVLRQTGLRMSSEDIQLYFQQHVLLKENGVGIVFWWAEAQLCLLLCEGHNSRRFPLFPPDECHCRIVFTWVWMYFQMNRCWEPFLSFLKPNFSLFSPDYLGLFCLGVGDGWEGVCWQLQLLIPEESQSAKKEMNTPLQHLQESSWGSPQGCGRAKTGWLNSAALGKTGFLVVAIVGSFLVSWNVLLLFKGSFCSSMLPVPSRILLLLSRWLFCLLSKLFVQMGLKFVLGAHYPEDESDC